MADKIKKALPRPQASNSFLNPSTLMQFQMPGGLVPTASNLSDKRRIKKREETKKKCVEELSRIPIKRFFADLDT